MAARVVHATADRLSLLLSHGGAVVLCTVNHRDVSLLLSVHAGEAPGGATAMLLRARCQIMRE